MLSSLNKKRNQSKNAIKEMVNYTLKNIFSNLNEDEKIKLLKAVIEISEGRIYVEVRFYTQIILKRIVKNFYKLIIIILSVNMQRQLKV